MCVHIRTHACTHTHKQKKLSQLFAIKLLIQLFHEQNTGIYIQDT